METLIFIGLSLLTIAAALFFGFIMYLMFICISDIVDVLKIAVSLIVPSAVAVWIVTGLIAFSFVNALSIACVAIVWFMIATATGKVLNGDF